MPNPSAPPLRVAECAACGQLFAVYETAGVVACPSCEASAEVESLEVAEIGVAAPVEVRVEAAPPADPPKPAESPMADSARPPTVAEWLMRGGDPSVAASAEPYADDEPVEPTPLPAGPKPSLSESLGWNSPVRSEAPVDPPERAGADRTPEPTSSDAFRFDFGATPLVEPADQGDVSLDLTTDDDYVTDDYARDAAAERDGADAPQTAETDWATPEAKPKRRWAGTFSAAAGLLLVAVPAGWLAWTWPEGDTVAASLKRAERSAYEYDDPADAGASTAIENEGSQPDDPFTAADAGPAPIVDANARPASFNQPAELSPPEPDTADTPPDPKPADAGDRYASAGDRYGSFEPEPDAFLPPEGGFDPISAEPPAPRALSGEPGELLSVPLASEAELTALLPAGEAAGREFGSGTLSDPEQVSAMGQAYARLCHLAQVLTLLDPVSSGPGVVTAEMEAVDVYRRLFRSARPREESRQIAAPWMAWTGRPHGGVFFAGTPIEAGSAGSVAQYLFKLGDQEAVVVTPQPLDTRRFMVSGATDIGVIGVVVDNPRERIAGYEGDAVRVVWARKTVPLGEAEAP